MFLRIEKGSAVPISRQIADQVRALCLARKITPGQPLPSVRQLARDLAVNQNTVLRVYERLAGEGFLEMRHGHGTFVAQRPPTWRLAQQQGRLVEELKQLIRQGRMLGLDDQQLGEAFQTALADSLAAAPPAETAAEKSR